MARKHRAAKGRALKVIDAVYLVGNGKMREEAWADSKGRIVRYNLAFIDHQICSVDNGRVLGYDTAHGHHHRHWMGVVEPIDFPGYEKLLTRFCDEIAALCARERA